jgi:hypothetical protein
MHRQPPIECTIDEAIATLVGLRETHRGGTALVVSLSFRENTSAMLAASASHQGSLRSAAAGAPLGGRPSSAFEQLQQRWKEANRAVSPRAVSPAALSAARRRGYTPPPTAVPPKPGANSSDFRNPSPWRSTRRVEPAPTAGPSLTVGSGPRLRQQQLLPVRSPKRGDAAVEVPVYRFDPRNVSAVSVTHSSEATRGDSVHISPIRRCPSQGPYEAAVRHPLVSATQPPPPAPRDLSGLVSPVPHVRSAPRRTTPRREFFDSNLEVHAVSPRRDVRESPRGRNGVAWVVDFSGGSRR